eukprot:1355851-Amorphochlora_amoeboformis.AAC.1
MSFGGGGWREDIGTPEDGGPQLLNLARQLGSIHPRRNSNQMAPEGLEEAIVRYPCFAQSNKPRYRK